MIPGWLLALGAFLLIVVVAAWCDWANRRAARRDDDLMALADAVREPSDLGVCEAILAASNEGSNR